MRTLYVRASRTATYLRSSGLDLEGDGLGIVVRDGQRALDELGQGPCPSWSAARSRSSDLILTLEAEVAAGVQRYRHFDAGVLGVE